MDICIGIQIKEYKICLGRGDTEGAETKRRILVLLQYCILLGYQESLIVGRVVLGGELGGEIVEW